MNAQRFVNAEVSNAPDVAATETWGQKTLTARWEPHDAPLCPAGDGLIPKGASFRLRVIGPGVEMWHASCAVAAGAPA